MKDANPQRVLACVVFAKVRLQPNWEEKMIMPGGLFSTLRTHAARVALKTSLAVGTALCASGPLAMQAYATQTPVVQTAAGKVQGYVNNYGVDAFLGVPYAAPPVGNLRWKPPVAHQPWKGVLSTTQHGAICAQITTSGSYAGPPNNNEDCLYLNVFTPNVKPGAKMPVFMFIHGGGIADDGGDYDGSKLASQGHTVVVTINYRLNLFGFLAVPALDHEGHLFGNYGFLDQQLALKWIKQNIANFGGDPTNVTLGGQSFGAQSTTAQMLSPLAKGLFNKAILVSGVAYITSIASLDLSLQKGTAFANAAGCGKPNYTTDTAIAQCLRNLSAAQVEALAGNGISYSDHGVYEGDTGSSSYVVFAVADGQIVPTAELAAIKSGNFTHVPILAGNTTNDYIFSVAPAEYYETPRKPLTEAQEQAYVTSTFSGNAGPSGSPPAYPPGTVAAVNAQYPLSAYPSPQLQWAGVENDSGKVCRLYHINPIWAKQVPFYSYEFKDQTMPDYYPPMPGFVMLSYHTGDLQYYFPLYHGGPYGTPHPLNTQQQVLSDQVVAAWTNFMYTGNPNGHGNSPWPLYQPGPNGLWFTENLKSPPPVVAHTYSPPITIPPATPPGLSTETNAQFSAEHHCAFWDTVLNYGP